MLSRTSKRQKRLYGLKPRAFPPYLRDEMEMDDQYRADLAKDPAAAKWLSAFNEESLKGVRIRGESHALDYETWRECNASRVRGQRNRDPLAFAGLRGSAKALSCGSEDEAIERIDTERAIALRRQS